MKDGDSYHSAASGTCPSVAVWMAVVFIPGFWVCLTLGVPPALFAIRGWFISTKTSLCHCISRSDKCQRGLISGWECAAWMQRH